MPVATRSTVSQLKRKQTEVSIDGNTYLLREMSGSERDTFEIEAVQEKVETSIVDGKPVEKVRRVVNAKNLRARLVALCWVDESGVRCYADDEVQQLADAIPASALGQLFDAAQKLNGLDPEAVEAAAKN